MIAASEPTAIDDRPGTLAEMGEALGRAGVSVEGGGACVVDGRDVVVQRLKQAVPGQLGRLTRRMADAGVNIEVLYSDHDHRLVLVVDDPERGRTVAEAWAAEGSPLP